MFNNTARISQARAEILQLVESSTDEAQRAARAACLDAFDRWAAGEGVDLFAAFCEADNTDRDDVADPLLDILLRHRIIRRL